MKRCLFLIFLSIYGGICVQLAFGLSQGEKLPGLQLWEERMNVARKYLLPRWEEAIAIANQYVPVIINRLANAGEIEFVKVSHFPIPQLYRPSLFELPYRIPPEVIKKIEEGEKKLAEEIKEQDELIRRWEEGKATVKDFSKEPLTYSDIEIRRELLLILEGYFPSYVYQYIPIVIWRKDGSWMEIEFWPFLGEFTATYCYPDAHLIYEGEPRLSYEDCEKIAIDFLNRTYPGFSEKRIFGKFYGEGYSPSAQEANLPRFFEFSFEEKSPNGVSLTGAFVKVSAVTGKVRFYVGEVFPPPAISTIPRISKEEALDILLQLIFSKGVSKEVEIKKEIINDELVLHSYWRKSDGTLESLGYIRGALRIKKDRLLAPRLVWEFGSCRNIGRRCEYPFYYIDANTGEYLGSFGGLSSPAPDYPTRSSDIYFNDIPLSPCYPVIWKENEPYIAIYYIRNFLDEVKVDRKSGEVEVKGKLGAGRGKVFRYKGIGYAPAKLLELGGVKVERKGKAIYLSLNNP